MSDFAQLIEEHKSRGQHFSARRPIFISRAPGRLDLMGGNVDYSGGLVFEAPIREATWAAAQLRDDDLICLVNPQMAESGWQAQVERPLASVDDEQDLRSFVNQSPSTRWTAYVLGVFHWLRKRWPVEASRGITVFLRSEVPLNKGVSSSAAVEVATMKAAAAAYGIELKGIELAEACQWVENVIAESACGIMDQATSVLGKQGHILPLLCQPCQLSEPVRLPEDFSLWAIDSGAKHEVTGIEYEAARAAGFVGYGMICGWEGIPTRFDETGSIPRYTDPRWNGYLCNLSPSAFRSLYEMRLPETVSGDELLRAGATHPDPFTQIRSGVTYRVRNCTRYAVEEHQRIELFVELLRGSEQAASERVGRLLGDLMLQSHWSYTECGLGAKATDKIIALVREELGPQKLYGAKITGGGAGGTVAVLGSSDAQASFNRVVERYAEHLGAEPYVFTGSSQGADEFGIQILAVTA
jgi:L-arabinokinase